MGQGIARNLDDAGCLTAAFDLDRSAFVEFSDGVQFLSGQALVDAADIILFAVPSNPQIMAFLDGCTSTRQSIVVDLTTSDPDKSRVGADDLVSRGFRYIDAAMTGGAVGADAGTLTLMLGGNEQDIAKCQPAFDCIASKTFHLGPVGSGQAMKLIHNMILHSSFMATCEGLRLADRAGLDLNTAVSVLNAGNARSFVTETRFPRDILSGTMAARSVVSNLEKDLGLATDFAKTHGGPSPYGDLTHALLAVATKDGHGQTDFSHLFELFEDLAEKVGSTK